jgi:hypothetical protein
VKADKKAVLYSGIQGQGVLNIYYLSVWICSHTNSCTLCGGTVEGEKTGDGISYASHVKNPNPLKARVTTFYDPVHNALDKEAQCA